MYTFTFPTSNGVGMSNLANWLEIQFATCPQPLPPISTHYTRLKDWISMTQKKEQIVDKVTFQAN